MIYQDKKNYYPTFILEDFLENPDDVVEYSKSLKFFKPEKDENWPGLRTKSLHLFNEKLFNYIVLKILSVYYDFSFHKVKYFDTNVMFHKIYLKDYLNFNKKHTNIHRDNDFELAGVLYLNKKFSEKTGTTIFDDSENEIIKISNNYNTLVCYDAKKIHGVNNILDEERLSIVIFIGKIEIEKNINERLNDLGKSYTVQE
jgi:wyosine [tRNA(Phe)-imidazoG37] synthetase (radical SAM superfamily)